MQSHNDFNCNDDASTWTMEKKPSLHNLYSKTFIYILTKFHKLITLNLLKNNCNMHLSNEGMCTLI